MQEIKDLLYEELKEILERKGFPPYRAGQIFKWIYKKFVTDFKGMTDIKKDEREYLEKNFENYIPNVYEKVQSGDGTTKYALLLKDKKVIESVLIPDGKRLTLCVSTQVGCPLGCKFCKTGSIGFIRNLSTSEILSQIIAISKDSGFRPTNIVFMGMGEPLLNLKNLVRAIKIIVSEEGMNFSPRKVTVSTAGIPHLIEELGKSVRVSLSVSLNAPDNEIRSKIMPINDKYPIEEIMSAIERYPHPPKSLFTIEYVMIKGVNSSINHAKKLASLLKKSKRRFKVNLINFNPYEGCEFEPVDDEIFKFQEELLKNSISTTIRKRKGADINAACGQLGGTASLYLKTQEV